MTPMESWALIALVFALVMAALIQGGRAIDWMLDRVFRAEPATRADVACPCSVDRDYHRRLGRVWE